MGASKEEGVINFSALGSHTLAGKIARFPLRILPRGAVLPILQGPLRGKKWIVGAHLHGCWLGSYEAGLQKEVAKKIKRGETFYDVGANAGFYTLLAADLIGNGRVYAFEPLPANVGYLRKHLQLNKVRNVEVLELAITDAEGTAWFEAEETRAMGRVGTVGNVRVQTSTLDALVRAQKIAAPDCIKMDIEGTKFRALMGARECFLRQGPKLFLATHGREVHDECCSLLSTWNYKFFYTRKPEDGRAELFAYPKTARQY